MSADVKDFCTGVFVVLLGMLALWLLCAVTY